MSGILRFTLVMGTLSSLFDLATFVVLLKVFHANAEQFRTAWFIESMATQILVIFVIRTYGPAWASRAQAALVASSLAALAVAVALVVTPLGEIFAFVLLPWTMIWAIGGLVAVYLASAEVAKKFASRRLDRRHLR